jgi:catechol 2,3-dioxygenase-like lactoylglutathione lyase family enzyme
VVQVLQSRVLLRPRDLDAAVHFYEDQVGLTRYREWGDPPRRGIVYFLGGGFLELTETAPDEPAPPAPSGFRLWLQVGDVAATQAALEAADVPIAEPAERKPWGLIELTVHDPDGVPLVMIETPIDHPLRRRA